MIEELSWLEALQIKLVEGGFTKRPLGIVGEGALEEEFFLCGVEAGLCAAPIARSEAEMELSIDGERVKMAALAMPRPAIKHTAKALESGLFGCGLLEGMAGAVEDKAAIVAPEVLRKPLDTLAQAAAASAFAIYTPDRAFSLEGGQKAVVAAIRRPAQIAQITDGAKRVFDLAAVGVAQLAPILCVALGMVTAHQERDLLSIRRGRYGCHAWAVQQDIFVVTGQGLAFCMDRVEQVGL